MTVFVTVGSTSFDDLIQTVCSAEILKLLKENSFKKIVLQVGRGSFIPDESDLIDVESFRFKESISDDIEEASLVIGHGGAGTILECLLAGKPLLAVVNERLMDGHQSELAEALAREGFLRHCTCSSLQGTLEEALHSTSSTKPFLSEPYMFRGFLENIMGFR